MHLCRYHTPIDKTSLNFGIFIGIIPTWCWLAPLFHCQWITGIHNVHVQLFRDSVPFFALKNVILPNDWIIAFFLDWRNFVLKFTNFALTFTSDFHDWTTSKTIGPLRTNKGETYMLTIVKCEKVPWKKNWFFKISEQLTKQTLLDISYLITNSFQSFEQTQIHQYSHQMRRSGKKRDEHFSIISR